jgi:hypothetical protein
MADLRSRLYRAAIDAPLTGAAAEGAEALKRGVPCLKFGRAGKPHVVVLTLASDETSLGWERRGLGKLMRKSERRCVEVTSLLECLVGMETPVFQRHAATIGEANLHRSLSLVLQSALPAPPSCGGDPAPAAGVTAPKESLDLSFDEEYLFGCMMAVLRALIFRVATCAASAASASVATSTHDTAGSDAPTTPACAPAANPDTEPVHQEGEAARAPEPVQQEGEAARAPEPVQQEGEAARAPEPVQQEGEAARAPDPVQQEGGAARAASEDQPAAVSQPTEREQELERCALAISPASPACPACAARHRSPARALSDAAQASRSA